MFDDITQSRGKSAGRRLATSALSIALHAGVVLGAVWFSARLAKSKADEPVAVTFYRAPPPPPPPPPAGHKAKNPRPHPTTPKPHPVQQLVQPKVIPQEKPPETKPEDTKPEEDEADDDEGVEGGVEGGVPGGVVGGVVGGVLGGVPSGTGNEPVQMLGGGMTRPEPGGACGPLVMPEQARTMGITGRVIVKYVVHSDGSVDGAKLQVMGSAPPILAEAVKKWLIGCQFKPAMQGGRPIAVAIIQPFNFQIN